MSMHTIPKSIEKLLTYLERVAKRPFSLRYFLKDKLKVYVKNFKNIPNRVVVSKNLFRQYNCLDYNCSRCCTRVGFWNIYTPKQYENLKREYPNEPYNGKFFSVLIDGKDYNFYIEDHTNKKCVHLDKERNLCRIHTANPIHCALPLIKFKYNSRTKITYITREYFSRNWFMQCPVKFKPMTEEGFNTTIWVLERVKDMAEELQIPTYMSEVIEEVKEIWRSAK